MRELTLCSCLADISRCKTIASCALEWSYCGLFGIGCDWTRDTSSCDTGLKHAEQYNRARHSSSATRKWITRDQVWPIEHAIRYVVGVPVSLSGPTGLYSIIFQACDQKQEDTIMAGFRNDLNSSCVKRFLGCLSCSSKLLNSPTTYIEANVGQECIHLLLWDAKKVKNECTAGAGTLGCGGNTCAATWNLQTPSRPVKWAIGRTS